MSHDNHYFMEKMCMDARGESSQQDIQRAEKRFGREKRKRAFPSVCKEPFDLQKYVEERERNVVVHRGVAMRVEQKPTRASDEAPLIVSEQWADAEKVEWVLPLDDRTTGAGEPSSTGESSENDERRGRTSLFSSVS